jgi:rhamnosyltransferase subunit B
LRFLPRWTVRAALGAIERTFLDPVILPGLGALRARLGLPPVRRVMSRWSNSPDRVICAFPDWFAVPQPDWPARCVTTDFPRWQESDGASLDPVLVRFLEAAAPPIGITPGSAMAHGRPVFERVLAACAALGLRVVIVTPYRDQLPATLPPSAVHVAYAPFAALLPRLAALVHHGGIGTSAQCLAAGIPQLVAPWAHDQFDNASRLRSLGVAERIGPFAGSAAWTRALRRLLHEDRVAGRCRELARKIAGDVAAATRIAEQIEALQRRPDAAAIRSA